MIFMNNVTHEGNPFQFESGYTRKSACSPVIIVPISIPKSPIVRHARHAFCSEARLKLRQNPSFQTSKCFRDEHDIEKNGWQEAVRFAFVFGDKPDLIALIVKLAWSKCSYLPGDL